MVARVQHGKNVGGGLEARRAAAGLCLSVALAFAVTNAVKNGIGAFRPDFAARCWPDGKIEWTSPGIPACHPTRARQVIGYTHLATGYDPAAAAAAAAAFTRHCFKPSHHQCLTGILNTSAVPEHAQLSCPASTIDTVSTLAPCHRCLDRTHTGARVCIIPLLSEKLSEYCCLREVRSLASGTCSRGASRFQAATPRCPSPGWRTSPST